MVSRPDILVLGVGGALGETWMTGVLAGIEDAHGIRFEDCDYLVGTSAGAVVAVRIAAGLRLSRPDATEGPAVDAGAAATHSAGPLGAAARTGADITIALSGPWIRFGFIGLAPIGARLRSGILRFAPPGTGAHAEMRDTIGETAVRFDGRLRVVAVERLRGNRVIFGSPGAPETSVVAAVLASCAVPGRFAPVPIQGVEYLDGGVWSPTNLDAAPAHRGARVLCLSPTGSLHGPLTSVMRVPSRGRTLLELAATRSVGASVELLTPDLASAAAIGTDPMSAGPAAQVLAAGYAQGLRS